MLNPLTGAAELLEVALRVEFRTQAGKYNWGFTALCFIGIVLLCVTDVFAFLLSLLKPEANLDPDYGQITIVGGVLFFSCMAVLVLEDRFAATHIPGQTPPRALEDGVTTKEIEATETEALRGTKKRKRKQTKKKHKEA